MDARELTILLNRDLPPAQAAGAWQANPLTLLCSLESGVDIDGATTIRAEFRAAHGSSAILAYIDIPVTDENGPWSFPFTTAQLNQPIRATDKSRRLWLEISARWLSPARKETLAVRDVTLYRTTDGAEDPPDTDSGLYVTAEELEEALAGLGTGGLTLVSTEADTQGYLTLRDPNGFTFRVRYTAGTPGPAGQPLTLLSTEEDGEGYLTLQTSSGFAFRLRPTASS